MKNYQDVFDGTTVVDTLRDITRKRRNDVASFNNLNNVFMRGRKVGKVPSASTDTDTSDRQGDFNYDANYLYLAVDNSGTLVWRRVALGTW